MTRSPNPRPLACFGAVYLGLGAVWACSSGPNPPPGGDTTFSHHDAGAGRGGDASGVSGDAGAGDGGAANERGDDGSGMSSAGDGGLEVEAGDGTTDSGPPVCDPMATWGSPGSIGGLPTGQGATAFTATPDELTVAWVQPTPGSEGGIQIYAAERASTNASFGPAQTLTAAAAYAAPDGISLTSDGLQLVVVRADRMAFAQVTRSSRSGTFGDPDETPYQHVNSTVVVNPTSMLRAQFAYLGDPVLGQDNLTLMYSGYGGNLGTSGVVSVYESQRSSSQDPFPPVTVEHDMGPLGVVHAPGTAGPTGPCGTCGAGADAGISESSAADAALIEARRHPTGVSSDGRTVFYWDGLAPGTGRAAWRPDRLVEFTSSEILGSDFHAIVTNASCTRLYFIQGGEFRVVEMVR
jgi:hypothetical protein